MARSGGSLIVRFFAIAFGVLVLGACGGGERRTAASSTATPLPPPQPLAAIDALLLPVLPAWIVEISPTVSADPQAQIRIRFKDPLIPLQAIESPDEQAKLALFDVQPALPGHFRFLTPRMVGFQADGAIPLATRVRVTLRAGLADLTGHTLSRDLAWTFETPAIKLGDLPNDTEPQDVKPRFVISSNVELDPASLARAAAFEPAAGGASVGADAVYDVAASPSPLSRAGDVGNEGSRFGPSGPFAYAISPVKPLETGTTYVLRIAPGVTPARGNLPTEKSIQAKFKTHGALTFVRVIGVGEPAASGVPERFTTGSPQMVFSNRLKAGSIDGNVTLAPAPAASGPIAKISDGEDGIDVNPGVLLPNTEYAITVKSGITDVFGQMLDTDVSATFRTGDVAADLWAPTDLNIFPSGSNLQLDITGTNLPDGYRAAYARVAPGALVYAESAAPEDSGWLPPARSWQTFTMRGPHNVPTVQHVPLRDKLGAATGMLAYGVQGRTYEYDESGTRRWRAPDYYGIVQLTNLGVFSEWFPDAGVVRVNHLSDGAPVAGAAIDLYQSKLGARERPPAAPCASGRTDGSGTWYVTSAVLHPCYAGNGSLDTAPEMLVIAREGADWAFARSLEYSGAYGYGAVYNNWDGVRARGAGIVYTDRELYQPGETATLSGVAYVWRNGVLRRDAGSDYDVRLSGPNGEKVPLGTHRTNAYGTFSVTAPFARSQALGYYSIAATGPGGVQIDGSLRIAQFRAPSFKVDLKLDAEFAGIGDTVHANGTSSYLFGAPVAGGSTTFFITRTRTDVQPKGWDDFSFGRQWLWPEEPPSVETEVSQHKTPVDAHGMSADAVTIADDLPYPMSYQVDMQTVDSANIAVDDTKSFTALPSTRLIGLSSDFVGEQGKPLQVKVIVTGPDGKPLSGQDVHLDLQQRVYAGATQIVAGGESPVQHVEYKTVASGQTRSGDAPATLSLTPAASGDYRIRANFADARSDASATDANVWVTGPSEYGWTSENADRTQLKLDKKQYHIGDTATVVIQSPYPQAELFFAVVRHGVLYKKILHVRGSAPTVTFPVTADMLPNAAVEAVVVRRGAPLSTLTPGSLDSLSRIGFAPLSIDKGGNRLTIDVEPAHASLQPGGTQSVRFHVSDARGRPAPGQLTVMVVNEAILNLNGYDVPDLVDAILADQTISTRFADNRIRVTLRQPIAPVQKGWGFGGGLLGGAERTRVRKNFKPLAYYTPALMTDASGNAGVTFALPDDLTTWRVMAVAIGTNATGRIVDERFGRGKATFVSTLPVLSNPVLPRFARPGDAFRGGVSVTNNANAAGALSLAGKTNGALSFAGSSPASVSQRVQAPVGTATYRFDMLAGRAGAGRLAFEIALNADRDAFSVPFEVRPHEVTESVALAGATTGAAVEPVAIARDAADDSGGLRLTLSSILLPQFVAQAKTFYDDDRRLPLLEPLASRIWITASLATAGARYHLSRLDFPPAKVFAADQEDLRRLQRPDGGFAAWPGAKASDAYGSFYAVEALAAARAAGLAVDADISRRGADFAAKELANPNRVSECSSDVCKAELRLAALLALAANGDRRSDFLDSIYEQRDKLSPRERARLARYLSAQPGWQTQAQSLSTSVLQDVNESARYATVNRRSDRLFADDPSADQSEVLRLLVARHASANRLDRAARSLMPKKRVTTWPQSYDAAVSLAAALEYARTQTPANSDFAATAALGAKQLAATRFAGFADPQREFFAPMADLPRGQNDLTLRKSSTGTLHYLAEYAYRPKSDAPGAIAGLRVTRIVRAANDATPLVTIGVAKPSAAPQLAAGNVYDVAVEVIADHPVDHVIVVDPLPAGFEAIDQSFLTSTSYYQAASSWALDYETIYADRIVAYASHLEAGVYAFHYLARAVTPGTFAWPGGSAHLEFAPEQFGRTASTRLTLTD